MTNMNFIMQNGFVEVTLIEQKNQAGIITRPGKYTWVKISKVPDGSQLQPDQYACTTTHTIMPVQGKFFAHERNILFTAEKPLYIQ